MVGPGKMVPEMSAPQDRDRVSCMSNIGGLGPPPRPLELPETASRPNSFLSRGSSFFTKMSNWQMSGTVANMQADIAGLLLADLKHDSDKKSPSQLDSESAFSSHRTSIGSNNATFTPADPIVPLSPVLDKHDNGEELPHAISDASQIASQIDCADPRCSRDSRHDITPTMTMTMTGSVGIRGMTSLRRATEQYAVEEELSFSTMARYSLNYVWIPLRVLGIIPWRAIGGQATKREHVLCLLYQWLILVVGVLGCVNSLLPFTQKPGNESTRPLCYSQATCVQIGLFADVAVALGAFLGLVSLVTHLGCPELVEFMQLIRSYANREDFSHQWHVLSIWEVATALVLWLAVMTERTRGTEVVQAALNTGLDSLTVLHILAFGLSSLILVALTFLVLHICHGLASAVDAFCAGLINSGDLNRGIHRWNVAQAILRKASGSIQLCLLVLQGTVLFTFLLGSVDFYLSTQQEISYASLLLPHALLTFGISRVFFRAAAVTEKCTRVPSLINAFNFGNAFDERRQYLVQYVEQSAAGFYVSDIRLTPAMTLKFAWICVLGLFTLATKIVSDQ